MQFKMTSCSEADAVFIEEQADNAFNTIAQPKEDADEELVFVVTV